MFHSLIDFFLVNGVGQNLTAGALVGIPSYFLARKGVREFRSHMAAHAAEIRKIHKHLGIAGEKKDT